MLGWSGIAAVISVNGVIAHYVRMAWNEDKDELAASKVNGTQQIKKEYRID